MTKKPNFWESSQKLIHKFTRFTKHQKTFVLYLIVLVFLLIVLPIIRISPVNDLSHSVWLLNWHLFTTMLIILISIIILLWWNMSFRFKNIIITYFGFKENDALINFWFLRIIATAFFSIWGTISVVNTTTQAIKVTWSYHFLQLFLLLGLILTLVSVIKHAKENSNKTKIVNVIDEHAIKEIQNRKSLKWLFEEEENDEDWI